MGECKLNSFILIFIMYAIIIGITLLEHKIVVIGILLASSTYRRWLPNAIIYCRSKFSSCASDVADSFH